MRSPACGGRPELVGPPGQRCRALQPWRARSMQCSFRPSLRVTTINAGPAPRPWLSRHRPEPPQAFPPFAIRGCLVSQSRGVCPNRSRQERDPVRDSIAIGRAAAVGVLGTTGPIARDSGRGKPATARRPWLLRASGTFALEIGQGASQRSASGTARPRPPPALRGCRGLRRLVIGPSLSRWSEIITSVRSQE